MPHAQRSLSDDNVEKHFSFLLEKGDRLAAVHLLLPYDWPYSLGRDGDGRVSARIELSNSSRRVDRDEEGTALLGAMAEAVRELGLSPPVANDVGWSGPSSDRKTFSVTASPPNLRSLANVPGSSYPPHFAAIGAPMQTVELSITTWPQYGAKSVKAL